MAAYNFPNSPSDGDTVTSNGITYTYSSSKTRWDGAAASGSSTTVYATIDDLPLSGASTGDQAYVEGNNRLYIWNGTGWYNIALINTTPSISGASSSYDLATDGTATTVTITATDPEGIPITYSIASDTSGNVATVTQGTGSNTNVFTITPSTNTANGGTFSLTFRASDGVNIATAVSQFTLLFSVANSNYTTALITSVGANNAVNNSFTDSSTNSHTITANGNVTQNTFSPYRHGGYSTYFDGSGDYLNAPYTVSNFGTGDFTLETWVYNTDQSGYNLILDARSGAAAVPLVFGIHNTNHAYYYNGTEYKASTTVPLNQWVHLAIARSGSTLKIFQNGVEVLSRTDSSDLTGTSTTQITIGRAVQGASHFYGYMSDFRIVKGTAVYTSAFTPPTESLTAITNTSLLTCHLPYIADGSTNSHSITVNGNTKTEPFSPYDHSGYSTAENGGSIYFDGSGDYLVTGADADQFVNSSNTGTIEMWLYLHSFLSPRSTLCGQWYSNSGWTFDLGTTGNLDITVNGALATSMATGLTLGRWHHFAVVNTGSVINVFTDGVFKSAQSNPSVGSASSSSFIVGARSDSSIFTDGFIADFRFVDGTVVYDRGSASVGDKVFTPPTAPLTAITNTSLLLNGTDAGIIDKSQSVKTITLNGNVKSSTTETKYLTSSMYFDGAGDYFDTEFPALGTGDFTIEFWMNPSTINSTFKGLIDTRFNNGNNPLIWVKDTNVIYFFAGADRIVGTTTLSENTWYHVALVRNSGTTTLYLDGTSEGTYADSLNYTEDTLRFGQRYTGTAYNYHGYLSDLRISKGLARYTSNFTPPTAALAG